MRTLKQVGWATGTVAARAGYSTQQIRNLERDGVLPPADRTEAGYRSYREPHLQSALGYRALAAGIGPVAAKDLMRTLHTRPAGEVLARLDAAHTGLDRERADVRLARAAVAAIADEPIRDVRPSDAMGVAELAAALGLRPSTLRHWDAEGLAVPDRVPPGRTRRYTPSQVRDARIVHQLRLAGYRIDTLRAVLPEVTGHGKAEVAAALAARDLSIENRSRALLDAAAVISRLLTERDERALL